MLSFHNIIILIESLVNENKNHYYYNTFLLNARIKINQIHNIFKRLFLYYRCYISIELTFLKELMLIRQANQKRAMFVTIGIF